MIKHFKTIKLWDYFTEMKMKRILLEAVKTQFAKLDDEVERTQKKLSDATKSTDRLRHRTEIIQRRMRNITELDPKEAEKLLELSDDEADTSTFD